jgi:TPR repeat protein
MLALALAAAMPAAAGAAETSTAKAAPAVAKVALPVIGDAAAEWQRFYAGAEAEETMKAYRVIAKMYEGRGAPGESCGQYLPELDAAIAKVPVGIALWHAGESCARALKDTALEQRYAEGFGKLAAYALSRSGIGPDSKPIAVISGDDTKAIVEATGLEVLYGYGDFHLRSPYLRISYALFDKAQGIERHLGFDYLDTYFRTSHKAGNAGFPSYRYQVRGNMVASMAKVRDDTTRDLGIADSSRREKSDKQLEMLRTAASQGGLVSSDFWWSICQGEDPGCADGLVDALLPVAEKGYAMYRLQIALAYATGVGIAKDMGAAMTLLDAAEKRWPGHAYARFAEQLMDNGTEVPAEAIERLDRAARTGNRRAMEAWAKAQIVKLGDKNELSPDVLKRMLELGDKDVIAATSALAYHYYDADPKAAREWLRRGAATGNADLMERYARAQIYGYPGARDLKGGIDSMRAAAIAGDAYAMYWMGMLSSQRKQWAEASNWYSSAIDYDNDDALVALLEMYWKPHEGVSPAPAELLRRYQAVEASGYDHAEFRRSYARYLVLQAEKRDPEKAKALLLVDANKDDANAQFQLGVWLLEGKLGPKDARQGMQWIDKATAKDTSLREAWANYMYYFDRSPEARKRAFAIERELVEADLGMARNNLAWWLCTSEDAAARAPAEGLKIALGMGEIDRVEAPALDTLAACHAAAGDFASAEQVQRVVVDRIQLFPMTEDDSELTDRLELYRQRKAYVEKREDEPKGDM